jgi:hypothetical protein
MLILGAVILVIGFVITLYFKNIVLFEGLLCGIAAYITTLKLLHFHPVFALLSGTAIMILLMTATLKTRAGFWVVSVLMSAIWSFVALLISELAFGEDIIWYIFCGAIGFFLPLSLHISVRKQH